MREIDVTNYGNFAMPDADEYIANGSFEAHKGADKYLAGGRLVIPEGTEIIPAEFCYGREDIEEVVLPASVRRIGAVAFAECHSLRRVQLNKGLEEIGDGAFLATEHLTEIEFPEGLRVIDQMGFYGSGLRKISVPASVERIGELCFWECGALERADVLGASCTIEKDAFCYCPVLIQGYIAPGFPNEDQQHSNLIFSLLWASEYERHIRSGVMVSAEKRRDHTSLHIYEDDPRELQSVSERAMIFIRKNRGPVLEAILKAGNVPALKGIIENDLFDDETLDRGLREASASGKTELATLFLEGRSNHRQADKDSVDLSDLEL